MIGPICPFLVEELAGHGKEASDDSVFTQKWTSAVGCRTCSALSDKSKWIDSNVMIDMEDPLRLRSAVMQLLDAARQQKWVLHSVSRAPT